jgi:hypothetical protein
MLFVGDNAIFLDWANEAQSLPPLPKGNAAAIVYEVGGILDLAED